MNFVNSLSTWEILGSTWDRCTKPRVNPGLGIRYFFPVGGGKVRSDDDGGKMRSDEGGGKVRSDKGGGRVRSDEVVGR